MAQKKLGRGLGALVSLAPASDDGTARLDEAIRAEPPEASVLALSGRSVEEFFRVAGVEAIVPPRPVPPPPPPPEPPPGSLAPPQESCADPEPVDDVAAADEEGAGTPEPGPTDVSPSPDDARQFLLFDPAVDEAAVVAAGDEAGVVAATVVDATVVDATAVEAGVVGAAVVEAGAPAAVSAVRPAVDAAAVREAASRGSTGAGAASIAQFAPVASPESAPAVRVAAPGGGSGVETGVESDVETDVETDETGEGGFVDDVVVVDQFVVADGGGVPASGSGFVREETAAATHPVADSAPRQPAAPAPAAMRTPEPPQTLLVDDVVFIDDSVGGIVLPDVELE
jgi:hypothetical protein